MLTIVNHYDLHTTADAFSAAVTALANRVLAEGHKGVLTYRFYVNPDAGQGRAVVDYADAAAWIGHHEIAMGWPEMQALHRAAKLSRVTFLGELTEDIRAWLARSGLQAEVDSGYRAAAGFRR